MTSARYLDPDDLAPKPDPDTGHPSPPRAPAFTGRGKAAGEDRSRESNQARSPKPPDGQGPVLVWYKTNRREDLIVAIWTVTIMVIGVTLVQGFSIQWMTYWLPWLILIVFVALICATLRRVQPSAGAEWVQQWGGGWVRTYELTKATAYSTPTGIHLNLTDSGDRHINISVSHLQKDRLMWDLVYNGIVHSVIAGGAETNGALHSALQVPRPKPAGMG